MTTEDLKETIALLRMAHQRAARTESRVKRAIEYAIDEAGEAYAERLVASRTPAPEVSP
jgi:hypothetical protein